jgi:5-(carboxyamino)imidazole ribonucleotide mutase
MGSTSDLPTMRAASVLLIGVPVESKSLHGLDSLLSIAQMPAGVPVATVAIGGSVNAALLAARILAVTDGELAERLALRMREAAEAVEGIALMSDGLIEAES